MDERLHIGERERAIVTGRGFSGPRGNEKTCFRFRFGPGVPLLGDCGGTPGAERCQARKNC